jgi:hypothetical protein
MAETFLRNLWSNLQQVVTERTTTGSFMHFPRIFHIVFVFFAFTAMTFAAKPKEAQATSAPAILPQQFAGWQMQGAPQISIDPASADPANAPVLQEYRFTDFASANYVREDGRTLKIRAARFADASGAFGAFTFYVQPGMITEQIGDQAASAGEHILFYRGGVMVDATFGRQSVMSGAELRELAGLLPRPTGNAGNLPTFIEFMPRQGYVAHTQRYVMGPAALDAIGTPIPAALVDFGASAEVSMARYSTSSGEATLMLISYPTPQLAADHLKQIDAAHQIPAPQAGVSTIGSSASFSDKRTGPIVAVVSGVSDSDAKSLLNMVNWEANVTWNAPAENQQVKDLYHLILNIVVLCAILGALAIVAGFAFGGFRMLMKRLYPDKVFDRPEQVEFISLRLTEEIVIVEEAASNAPAGDGQAPQNPA